MANSANITYDQHGTVLVQILKHEVRCQSCDKLLAKGKGTLEIKCPRCKYINLFTK